MRRQQGGLVGKVLFAVCIIPSYKDNGMAGSDEIGGVIVAEMLFIIKIVAPVQGVVHSTVLFDCLFYFGGVIRTLERLKKHHILNMNPCLQVFRGKHPKPRYRVIILIHRAAPPGEIRG